MNCERFIEFYARLGMLFKTEDEEGNTKYYSYVHRDLTFEIKEVDDVSKTTQNASFRFLIDEIDGCVEGLNEMGRSVRNSWRTEEYYHVQLNDPDENLIELMTKNEGPE